MADKHPYTPTQSYLTQIISQLRKSFPPTIKADTLKKLGFAPKNESYVLNILRFLGIIDQDGNKTELASKVFSLHEDAAFSTAFGKLVSKAYSDLFGLHGDDAWSLAPDGLITFFRTSDQTSDVVGKLQATTFQSLAMLSGRREAPEQKISTPRPVSSTTKKKPITLKTSPTAQPLSTAESVAPHVEQIDIGKRDVGLTVRIEINLPADGDQETYDRIFRSIRENLLNG